MSTVADEQVTDEQVTDEQIAQESLQQEASPSPAAPEETVASATGDQSSQAATEEIQSLRDAATEQGFDLSGYEDDQAALQHLIQQARESEQKNQELQQYQQWYQQVQQAAQQQQQAPQQPAQEEAPLWNPPEFNPMWLSQVRADDRGNMQPINGGTPETVAKLQKWIDYRQGEQDRFWNNPFEYLDPYIQKAVDQRVQGGLQQAEEQQTARRLVSDNADWIWTDSSRSQFSEDGLIFQNAIDEVKDIPPESQFRYAMRAVNEARKDRKIAELEGRTSASDQHEQKKAAAVQQATRTTNQKVVPPEQNENLPLHERMMAALKARGITDIQDDNV